MLVLRQVVVELNTATAVASWYFQKSKTLFVVDTVLFI